MLESSFVIEKAEGSSPLVQDCCLQSVSVTPVQFKYSSRSSEGAKKSQRERIVTSDFQTKLFGSSPPDAANSSAQLAEDSNRTLSESISAVEDIVPKDILSHNNVNEETIDEKYKREQRESELLAWEMLREESAELYQMQIEFMRENAADMSEEDMNALRMAMDESGRPEMYFTSQINYANNSIHDINNIDVPHDDDQSLESSEADMTRGGEESEDPDNWDYERLLALGQILGDVKTDRWRQKAPTIIASLPATTYARIQQQNNHSLKLLPITDSHDSESPLCKVSKETSIPPPTPTMYLVTDYRCAVCMEDFEPSDKLSLLPCRHYFHSHPCCSGWLQDHNSCPICKSAVAADEV